MNSMDSDGYIKAYTWDFGDGETGEGVFVQHQYKQPGNYQVSLQV